MTLASSLWQLCADRAPLVGTPMSKRIWRHCYPRKDALCSAGSIHARQGRTVWETKLVCTLTYTPQSKHRKAVSWTAAESSWTAADSCRQQPSNQGRRHSATAFSREVLSPACEISLIQFDVCCVNAIVLIFRFLEVANVLIVLHIRCVRRQQLLCHQLFEVYCFKKLVL